MTAGTIKEALAEVRRELSLRDRVYPAWVAKGTLKEGVARVQVQRMEAAQRNLERLERAELLASMFFEYVIGRQERESRGLAFDDASRANYRSRLVELLKALGIEEHKLGQITQ